MYIMNCCGGGGGGGGGCGGGGLRGARARRGNMCQQLSPGR